MFPTLKLNARDSGPSGPVHDAQWLMAGHGRFGETYYTGKIDGDFGAGSAGAAYVAKFWCGWPLADLDHAFGPVLYSYLLPATSAAAARLPLANRARRAARIAAKLAAERRYRNPYRDVQDLMFDGVDQGVDYTGHGPVYAIGPGRVTVATTDSGWPGGGAVSYTLTSGSRAGRAVYFAENITPRVYPGQWVNSGTVIATMYDAFPYTESGWCFPGTDNPLAPIPPKGAPTAEGEDFYSFLQSLGAP
jgi:hypothetical protein